MVKAVLKLNTDALDEWVRKNQPMPVERLAVAARISTKTADQIINDGFVPKQSGTRWRVAHALGVAEEILFLPARRSRSA